MKIVVLSVYGLANESSEMGFPQALPLLSPGLRTRSVARTASRTEISSCGRPSAINQSFHNLRRKGGTRIGSGPFDETIQRVANFLRGGDGSANCILVGIVTVGEHDYIANVLRQMERAKARGRKRCPHWMAACLHCSKARLDTFADHKHIAGRPELDRAALAWPQTRWQALLPCVL
jgi:hypothetical protein